VEIPCSSAVRDPHFALVATSACASSAAGVAADHTWGLLTGRGGRRRGNVLAPEGAEEGWSRRHPCSRRANVASWASPRLDLSSASTALLQERAGAAGSGTEEEVAPGHDPISGPRLHRGEGSRWRWDAPHERGRGPPSRLAGVAPGHAGEQSCASWRGLRRDCTQCPRPPGAPSAHREGGRAGAAALKRLGG
jgi:hypothetical protein